MTDWENYTKLCNLKDSVFSICPSIQTSNYRNFHRMMYKTPYDYMDNAFLTSLATTYSDIHFSPRLRDNELITDLIDTPPQVQTSGMAIGGGNNAIRISGQVVSFINDSIQHNFLVHPPQLLRPVREIDNTSSLWGKFIRKISEEIDKI